MLKRDTTIAKPPMMNIFSQRSPNVMAYNAEVDRVNHNDSSTGSTLRFTIVNNKLSVIGNMILSLKISQNVTDCGEFGWVPCLGYALIKSMSIVSNNIKMKLDKYYIMKMLHTNVRTSEARDNILWHAGNREELVNLIKVTKDSEDIKSRNIELNILLPLPNMNSLPNSTKHDKCISVEIELEQLSKLVSHSVSTQIRSNVKLSEIDLTFESVIFKDSIDKTYTTEICTLSQGKSISTTSHQAAIKEVGWMVNTHLYTDSCTLPFYPRFKSTRQEIINDYVNSLLSSLVVVCEDIDSIPCGNAILKEVKNSKVVINRVEVGVLIRGLPTHMKAYYNSNILEKLDECKPNAQNINLSLLFKRIICDYYEELDLLIFNHVEHDIDIGLASIPIDLWKSGTGISGDNRLASKKNDFVFTDHFRLGSTLEADNYVNNSVVIDYDKNPSVFKGTDNVSKLLYATRTGSVLPSFYSGFLFTFTPSNCLKSGYLNVEAGKNMQVELKYNEGIKTYIKTPVDQSTYCVEYVDHVPEA